MAHSTMMKHRWKTTSAATMQLGLSPNMNSKTKAQQLKLMKQMTPTKWGLHSLRRLTSRKDMCCLKLYIRQGREQLFEGEGKAPLSRHPASPLARLTKLINYNSQLLKMEVEDIKLREHQHVQVIRDAVARVRDQLGLPPLLQQLKQAVKNQPALKEVMQELVNFFMLCQSNHQPSSPEHWHRVLEEEIKRLDRLLMARNRYQSILMKKAFQGFRHRTVPPEQGTRLSLGQYAMTLKTEQSLKLHSFCFKSQKNMPVLYDSMAETPIKATTKLKSKAFYAWTKFLQLSNLSKLNKQQEVTNLKRAHEYNVLYLKLKTLYSCKQFVQQRKQERAKADRLTARALVNRKSEYFQMVVDRYAIIKIEGMLARKVVSLTNRLTKVKALKKLGRNAATAYKHQGYPNYRCVLFLKYLLEEHCQRKVVYDQNAAVVSLQAGSRTDKQNLQKQLGMMDGMLKSKAFLGLKMRAEGLKRLKVRVQRRTLGEVMDAYVQEIGYRKNQSLQLKQLTFINRKYFFRKFVSEVQKIPVRRAQIVEAVDMVTKVLQPLLKQSFFRWLKTNSAEAKLRKQVTESNSRDLLKLRRKTVLVELKGILNTQISIRDRSESLACELLKLQRRNVFERLRSLKNQQDFRQGITYAADKLYETRLLGRMFSQLVVHVKQMQQLYTNTHTLYEWVRTNRKQLLVQGWATAHKARKAANKKIRGFQTKGLQKYLMAISKFNQQEKVQVQEIRTKKSHQLKKQVLFQLAANCKLEQSIESRIHLEYTGGIQRKGFAALLKNMQYMHSKRKLADTLQHNRKVELFENLSIQLQERVNAELATLHIIKHGSFCRLLKSVKDASEEGSKVEWLQQHLSQIRRAAGARRLLNNLSKDYDLRAKLSKSAGKLKLILLRKYMGRVQNEISVRKQIKSLGNIAKRRQVYLIKQACRHIRKAVPKLIQLKSSQRKITRQLLLKNLRKLKNRIADKKDAARREQLRIAPIRAHSNTRLLTRAFELIQQKIAAKKNLVKILVHNFRNAQMRVYSDSLLTIFEDYSHKSRSLAVCHFYKKRCFSRLMESFVRRSNNKLLEFKSVKSYARTLLKKAMNSLIINNQQRQNTAQQFHQLNVQKWKLRLEGIGNHSRPASLRACQNLITLPDPRRSRASNSHIR